MLVWRKRGLWLWRPGPAAVQPLAGERRGVRALARAACAGDLAPAACGPVQPRHRLRHTQRVPRLGEHSLAPAPAAKGRGPMMRRSAAVDGVLRLLQWQTPLDVLPARWARHYPLTPELLAAARLQLRGDPFIARARAELCMSAPGRWHLALHCRNKLLASAARAPKLQAARPC